jgi:hypothetical protein
VRSEAISQREPIERATQPPLIGLAASSIPSWFISSRDRSIAVATRLVVPS